MTTIDHATTRTGHFPIGLRRLGSAWQNDTDRLIAWAAENRFSVLDLERSNAARDAAKIKAAGLRVGTVDLLDGEGHRGLVSAASAGRQGLLEKTMEHIEACASAGARHFFAVAIPADKGLPPRENFAYFVECYAALVPTLERTDSRIAIEGWPGPGVVCCTPETYRAAFREIGSERIGINYDPSHLLRMGIDPVRFVKEFADRVFHVHGKDTLWETERLYECGHEVPGMFAQPYRWGGTSWRYTIPGGGPTPWSEIFEVLSAAGYRGAVGIELEDTDFNGTEEGEKLGFIKSRQFLEGC